MGSVPFVRVVMVSNVSLMSVVEVVISFKFVIMVSMMAFPVSMVVCPASIVAVPVGVVTIVVSVVEVSVSFEVVMMGVEVMMTLVSVMGVFSTESNTVLFVFVKSTVADGAVQFVVELGSMVWNFPGRSIPMVAAVPSRVIEVNIVVVFVSNAVFFAVTTMMRFNWVSFFLLWGLLFR